MVPPESPPSSYAVLMSFPALARLALDERLACLALGVQRVEVLLETRLRALARIDRAAPCSVQ